MPLSERDRRELHAAVERHLGARAADLLLAMNEPELPFVLRGEMAELRGEMAELRSELRGEMVELRSELRGEMAELRSELRGGMAKLGGEVSKVVPRVWAANLASMVGVAGVVIAAGALL